MQTTRQAAAAGELCVLSSAVCPPQVTPSNPDDFEQGHDAGTFVQTALADKTLQLAPHLSSHMRGFPLLSDSALSFQKVDKCGRTAASNVLSEAINK